MNKYKYIRYFAYTIEILAIFVLQETPGLIPELYGGRPLLLIPAALSIAMFESVGAGMGFGILCGLLLDFGAGSLLGFYGLLLSVVCYFVALIAANLIQTNFLTAMITFLTVCAGIFLLHWFFFYLLSDYEYPLYALTAHYIPRFVYTLGVSPVLYYFNRAFAVQIRPNDE